MSDIISKYSNSKLNLFLIPHLHIRYFRSQDTSVYHHHHQEERNVCGFKYGNTVNRATGITVERRRAEMRLWIRLNRCEAPAPAASARSPSLSLCSSAVEQGERKQTYVSLSSTSVENVTRKRDKPTSRLITTTLLKDNYLTQSTKWFKHSIYSTSVSDRLLSSGP